MSNTNTVPSVRAALKQIIDADDSQTLTQQHIEVGRAALAAQPAAKPVAWLGTWECLDGSMRSIADTSEDAVRTACRRNDGVCQPLHTGATAAGQPAQPAAEPALPPTSRHFLRIVTELAALLQLPTIGDSYAVDSDRIKPHVQSIRDAVNALHKDWQAGAPAAGQAAPACPSNTELRIKQAFNEGRDYEHERLAALAAAAPAQAQAPIHITTLADWLAARYRAAGGKEGVTDVSAWAEEVMRWTEKQHGIPAPIRNDGATGAGQNNEGKFS